MTAYKTSASTQKKGLFRIDLNTDSLKTVLTQLEEESPKPLGEFPQPIMQSPSCLISSLRNR